MVLGILRYIKKLGETKEQKDVKIKRCPTQKTRDILKATRRDQREK